MRHRRDRATCHKVRLKPHSGMLSHRKGQMAPSAVVLVMLLMVLAGVLVDGLHILTVWHRAYRLAADAALQGVREGTDYWAYIWDGVIRLKEAEARDRAEDVVLAGISTWGLDNYTVRVEVLPAPGGGTVASFPPHPNAQQRGGTTLQTDRPGVGVYIEADVPTFFLGWFNGSAPISVHAFSASLMETESEWLP